MSRREAIELVKAFQEKNQELERQLERQLESAQCERNEWSKEKELLREQINDLLRRIYGQKSERFEHPGQKNLFEVLGVSESETAGANGKTGDTQTIKYDRRRPQKHGPKPLPEHLERVVIHIDPPEGDCICGVCSKKMERVDEVVTEEIDIVPPQIRVKQYVQSKWRCREHMNRDRMEVLPARPIQKGRPSPTLLAYIIVSKYVDHIPLNRQEGIFKRHGIQLARSTMNGWLGQLSHLLQPIVLAMRRWLFSQDFLQLDETPIQALDRTLPGKSRRCYIWAYCIPRGEVVYDVTESRSGRGPKKMLENFSGHLQADGYAGFHDLFRSGRIAHVACMAHVRRKFVEAEHAAPERVREILMLIRSLYAVEEELRENEVALPDRSEIRREKSLPVLCELKSRIDELRPIPVPRSKLGRAVEYALGQWDSMRRYVDVSESEIDNNWCELAIRPVVVGRKNFMFLGSVKGGGERAETFYSLVQTCKRLKIDPFAYLSDVIERIPSVMESRIDELTPRRWMDAQARAEKQSSGTAL